MQLRYFENLELLQNLRMKQAKKNIGERRLN